jgi:CheY-like chemotaxis protein
VARILHVEDKLIWLDIIKTRLKDHHVDSADSLERAIDYLQSGAPYDLALVDLNLSDDSDQRGGEVLDLLREVYPGTRRVVITGSPPVGPVRATVFERYDVEEIIIKGQFDAPGLRRVVEEALARTPSGLSVEFRLKRSELRQRYRDWRRRISDEIRHEARKAEEHKFDATSEQTQLKAEMVIGAVKLKRLAFDEDSNKIRELLDNIRSAEQFVVAADALGAAEDRFSPVFDDEDLG